jgi:hypothetical protein
MNYIIEDTDEIQFANGQSGRDLQVSSDASERVIESKEATSKMETSIRNMRTQEISKCARSFSGRPKLFERLPQITIDKTT